MYVYANTYIQAYHAMAWNKSIITVQITLAAASNVALELNQASEPKQNEYPQECSVEKFVCVMIKSRNNNE